MSHQRNTRQRAYSYSQQVLEDAEYELRSFGESLKCPNKYEEDANNLSKKVLQTIRKESKFPLGKHEYGGSYAKKTDVLEPDLDIVIRFKNCQPPFNKLLNHMEKIIRSNESYLQIQPGSYKKSERALSFSFKNGIPMDLLPAEDITEEKVDDILEKTPESKKTKKAYYLSPALVENQVDFLKSQTSFTHTLVRLSKFCFRSWYLGGESCRGASTMMECMAVAAANKEEQQSVNNNRSPSEFQALREVMVMLTNLDTLKLAFSRVDEDDDDDYPEWERVKPSKLTRRNSNWLVPDTVGKREFLERPCFIIDPANPFQDYLEDKSKKVVDKLKNFGRTTRDRLDRLLREGSEREEVDEEFIQKLFRPIPKNLTKEKTLILPDNFLLTCDTRCNSIYNKVEFWNKNLEEDLKIQRAVEVLKNNLVIVVHSTVKGNPDEVSIEDVENAVEELIENNLQTGIGDAPRWDKHSSEYYDVMIKIPYTIRGKGYAVRFSLGWD